MILAGSAPEVLGTFELKCPEFMYVQYLPILMPESEQPILGLAIPKNLEWCLPLISAVIKDFGPFEIFWGSYYIYLTVKHMHVEAGTYSNRPGWHIDGFGTDDVNYIWYDSNPTEFCISEMHLSEDHEQSIREMEANAALGSRTSYPVDTLLKLDNRCVHRCDVAQVSGVRTFVKISVSKHRYNLKGNAHNYLFDYEWEMYEREKQRNHPIKEGICSDF